MLTSLIDPQSSPLATATDGSVLNQYGTFRWTISTNTGKCLVTCSGWVYGHSLTSYHAECYGLLFLLRFLLQLHLYTGTPTPQIELHTDSESLISKISQMTTWNTHYPVITLQPKWDMLQAILNMLKKLSTQLQLSHIKSHQDDEHEYN